MFSFLYVIATALISSSECSRNAAPFIGLGYNILLGNPDGGDLPHAGVDVGIKSTRNILRITDTTARHLIVNDGKTQCVPSISYATFYGGKSYQDYLLHDIETRGLGDDAIRPYAFTKSIVYKDIDRNIIDDHVVFHDKLIICNTGYSRYVMPPLFSEEHSVGDEFANTVCALPRDYDKNAYQYF